MAFLTFYHLCLSTDFNNATPEPKFSVFVAIQRWEGSSNLDPCPGRGLRSLAQGQSRTFACRIF